MWLLYLSHALLLLSVIPKHVDALVPSLREFKQLCCDRNLAVAFITIYDTHFHFLFIVELVKSQVFCQ